MNITSTVKIRGAIRATGKHGNTNNKSGGSGGSIYIVTSTLEGHGTIEVIGIIQ